MVLEYSQNITSTRPCDDKTMPQIIFLGASVVSYTCNLGWGGQPSSLNVNLVEDRSDWCGNQAQYSGSGGGGGSAVFGAGSPNDYHNLQGDSLYVERDNTTGVGILPGKLYYKWQNNQFQSLYYTLPDMGFFGKDTFWTPSGGVSTTKYSYDIIGCPVYFRSKDFEFAGLIKNWDYTLGSGGAAISVTIESPNEILNNSHIIIDKYRGSIFSKLAASSIGRPNNYTGTALSHTGFVGQGAIPNVFNVFGFLENYGFGESGINEQGIPVINILNALQVLAGEQNKSAYSQFSPWGRIIHRVASQTEPSASNGVTCPIGFYNYGLLPPTADANNQLRHQYILDLSDLPRIDGSFRLKGPTMTISELIQQVCDATARDYFVELIPYADQGSPGSIIKIRTVNRLVMPALSKVKDTINSIAKPPVGQGSYYVSSISYGQESNSANNRTMLIGGNQQRLFQAKNYRLAYTQTNYLYDSASGSLVNPQFKNYAISKGKEPNAHSVRNPATADLLNGEWSWVYQDENEIVKVVNRQKRTIDTENLFCDGNVTIPIQPFINDIPFAQKLSTGPAANGQPAYKIMNYYPSYGYENTTGGSLVLGGADNAVKRYISLEYDIISPFFGFDGEEQSADTTGLPEESFKKPRQVYLDQYTGQLLVSIHILDLPPFKHNISSLYQNSRFIVSETEMRAASAGFDNLMIYYMSKTFKPDLIIMLINAYVQNGNSIVQQDDTPMGLGPWGMVEDQNTSDSDGYPSVDIYADMDEPVNVTNILYSKSFTEDLILLHRFIADIASKYYGRAYTVQLPRLKAYRDWDTGGMQSLGSDIYGNTINVWTGMPKTITSYSIATDGAWEEPGNTIDDTVVVGSKNYYGMCDQTGKIQPLLGYNAMLNFDRVAWKVCNTLSASAASTTRLNNPVFGINFYSMYVNEFSGGCDTTKYVYPSLDMSNVADNYVLVNQLPSTSVYDPYRNNTFTGSWASKLYTTTTVRPDIYFDIAGNFDRPKAILDAPGLLLNSSSLEHTQDPNRTVVSNVALEDLLTYLYGVSSTNWDYNLIRSWASRLSYVYSNSLLRQKTKKSLMSQMVDIAPKAAHPFFAAVPLKYEQFVYGPWINYPHKSKDAIFKDYPSSSRGSLIENLTQGVRVEIDESMVPWNYGGASLMDKAGFLKIGMPKNSDTTTIPDGMNTYQNVLETGSFEIPGTPIYGLGGYFTSVGQLSGFVYSNQSYTSETEEYTYTNVDTNASDTYTTIALKQQSQNLPLITNMQVSVSESGLNTSYSLKTYSKPLNRFNKEAADRISRLSKQTVAMNQKNAKAINKVVSDQLRLFQQSMERRSSGAEGYSSKDASKKLFGWSPVEIIMGAGTYYGISPKSGSAQTSKSQAKSWGDTRTTGSDNNNSSSPNMSSSNTETFTGPRGPWNINSDYGGSSNNTNYINAKGKINTLIKDLRHSANLGIYQSKERGLDEKDFYGNRAIMSLDGIFSPISFYPTEYNSCYSLAKWPKSRCPICCGNKTYTRYLPSAGYAGGSGTSTTVYCNFCYEDNNQTPSTKIDQSITNDYNELPPFLLVENTDSRDVLSDEYQNTVSHPNNTVKINYTSLQPILQTNGDFQNPNAQSIDKKRHSIGIVGRGAVHHGEALSGVTDIIIKNNIENGDYNENPDFHGIKDLRLEKYMNKAASASHLNPCSSSDYPLNNRFIGLRGPLMLHSWGYDMDGFPVPNSSKEPKIVDSNGRFKRHARKIKTINGTEVTDENGNPVYIDDYDAAGNFTELGSVISTTSNFQNGKWSKPYKTDKFYLNWGERPDLWPVGPIDLRWDDKRKVWAAPQPKVYKNVYVTLEEDLKTLQEGQDTLVPARGFISDLEHETTGVDARKVVFVVDQAGYTAPKGAKLLCFYNPNNGFYEVISKPTFICDGGISGGTATINATFIDSRNKGLFSPTINVTYKNSIGVNVTAVDRGVFVYSDGNWQLIAAK